MKYMRVPDPVKLTDVNDTRIVDDSGKDLEITFKQFVVGRLSDPKFSTNMDMIMSAVAVKTAVKEAENGVMVMDTADWRNLVDVVRNPSPQNPYNPLFALNLLPFMHTVVNAKDSKEELEQED